MFKIALMNCFCKQIAAVVAPESLLLPESFGNPWAFAAHSSTATRSCSGSFVKLQCYRAARLLNLASSSAHALKRQPHRQGPRDAPLLRYTRMCTRDAPPAAIRAHVHEGGAHVHGRACTRAGHTRDVGVTVTRTRVAACSPCSHEVAPLIPDSFGATRLVQFFLRPSVSTFL